MLLTKLHIPPIGNTIVHRSTLFEKLNVGLSRKLTLISAPAGFGKTTLLSDWINTQKIPTAWFSLDKGDNDPVEFLSYIISGIQTIHKEFGHSTLLLLKSSNEPSTDSIAGLLINDMLKIDQNFLLVLDDFHLIGSDGILKLVSFLIERIPENVHIVIITRSDPTLPIARLRSQQQVVELRSSDLSFSANDISILFNKKLKLGLSIEDVYSLENKTEGWIAGLQLTAISLQGREDISEFIQNLKGDNRYIMDYLIEEVLKIQSDDIKEFLLRTSMLEQFSAPLCNAVLNRNDSQQILEKLENNNMFVIPLDSDRNWYRYHHLFADLLKQRLLIQEKVTIDELHNKACDWYEQNDMFDFAIEHALEIKNYEKAIQLLDETVGNMWENGLHAAILKYGDLLPEKLIMNHPEFCLYYAWILISAGQLQRAEPYLKGAEEMIINLIKAKNSAKEEILYEKKLLGKISVAFAYMYSYEDRTSEILDYCKKAMNNLSEDDHLWLIWVWYSYGIAYYSTGNLQESIKSYQYALDYGKKSGNIYLLSTIVIRMADNEQQLGHYKAAYNICTELLSFMRDRGYLQLTKSEWSFAGLYSIIAITHLMWADLDKAYDNIKIAYDLCKNNKDITLRSFVVMFYIGILYSRGDKNESEIKSKELEEILKENEVTPYLKYSYISWKAFNLVESNQLNQVENLFTENGLKLDEKKSPINDSAYAFYARVLIAQLKFDEAEKLLSELYNLANEGKRIERLIDLNMIYANLFETKGNREKAVLFMIKAFELAAPENLVMFVVYNIDFNNEVLKEVYKTHAAGKTNIPKEFIDNLKQVIVKKEKQRKNQQESSLSDREMDILKLFTDDLSNQDIADKLFISLNTVKTHVKNIYLKLEADSRTKAIAKAREIGLI